MYVYVNDQASLKFLILQTILHRGKKKLSIWLAFTHTSTRQMRNLLFFKHFWSFNRSIVVPQVIVKDVVVLSAAGLQHLQNSFEAPVQGSEVGLGQERGNVR